MARALLTGMGLVAVVTVAAGALVVHTERGHSPPPPRPLTHEPTRPWKDEAVHVAGSGSNLPLTRRLADAYAEAHPDASPVIVHRSIGTTGGVRAVREGAIDLGLASRPLRDRERPGLQSLPYARVAVVLAADPGVPEEGVSREQLLAIYAGQHARWDDGQPVVALQRERGDSSHRAVERVIPAFRRVNDDAWRQGRFRVLYTDRAMLHALMTTPGGVGLSDLGSIATDGLPLKVLAVDGVEPSPDAVSAGRYPFSKDLAFVVRGRVPERARPFVRYVFGAQGRAILRACGYVPLPREGR